MNWLASLAYGPAVLFDRPLRQSLTVCGTILTVLIVLRLLFGWGTE